MEYRYNTEKWNMSNNVLFITGLSGSGKTTLANHFSYRSKIIHLDDFLEKEYFIPDDEKELLICDILANCKSTNELYVAEGIQIYELSDRKKIFDLISFSPMIIILEDVFVCLKRVSKRDNLSILNDKNQINYFFQANKKLMQLISMYKQLTIQ